MNKLTEAMSLDTALQIAYNECNNPYAKTYLQAMPQARAEYGEQGVKTQILYALNNMSGWRGETARSIKKILRAAAK